MATKHDAAQLLGALGGKARAKKLTAQRQAEIGRIAGRARMAQLTAAERSALGKMAARAKWAKRKAAAKDVSQLQRGDS